MKRILISSIAIVLFVMIYTLPVYSQPEPEGIPFPEGLEAENFDIFVEVGDDDVLAFANIESPDDELINIELIPEAGERKFFGNFDGKGHGRHLLHDSLKLTDGQKEKIKALRLEHQRDMIDLRANLQKAKLDAKEIKDKDNISRSEVISSVEKINKIKNEISLASANHRMDVYEILTPEQKEIWKDLKNDFPRRVHKGMDRIFKKHMLK